MEAHTHNFDRAIRWVAEEVAEGKLPTAVFGVATSRGVELIEPFGSSAGRPVEVDDRFALFSMTKPIVGLAAMRAVERGELSIRARLAEALPQLRAGGKGDIRLDHLLSHRSGIADVPLDSPGPLRDALLQAKQELPPGEGLSYSNLAFEGVAAMLEHFTGRGVSEHLADIARSSGSDDISFDPDALEQPVLGADAVNLNVDEMLRHRHPGAGAIANANTILAVSAELLRAARGARNDLIEQASLYQMLEPRTVGLPELDPQVPRKDYGLAWNLKLHSEGVDEGRAFGHEGWSGTQWWVYPEWDVAFVLMTNLLDLPRYGIDIDQLNNAFTADLPAGRHEKLPIWSSS